MSELINNREVRKETLKSIIKQLHAGKTVEEVKEEFAEVFEGVSAAEISEAETALMMEGIPAAEIQNLCDVHAAVFKGSIEEIHNLKDPAKIPGHPVNIFMAENRMLEKIIDKEIMPHISNLEDPEHYAALKEGIKHLKGLTIHYDKKENLLFPYMEKYEVTAPPQVMWGVDDQIRLQLQGVVTTLEKPEVEKEKITKYVEYLIERVKEMIFKEENIMFPMLIEKLTEEEWLVIAEESHGFGFLVKDVPVWKPVRQSVPVVKEEKKEILETGIIQLPTGSFKVDELKCVLNTLPFDMTFVNKDDVVQYFSEGKERIFARARTVIGRNVSNCHPPASVHIVEQIVEDFKSGKKENEDFWIKMGDKYVLIRYFAVRDDNGEYLGVLEVTQNIAPIQSLTDEKRLVSE